MHNLSASNLAWNIEEDDKALALLVELGFDGVEIAPTKLWGDWDNITDKKVFDYAKKLSEIGLKTSSLQSILFGFNTSLIAPKNYEILKEHFKRLAQISNILGSKILIVGSPSLRKLGGTSAYDAEQGALELWQKIGDIIAPYEVQVGFEANPSDYGCEFLVSQQQVANFVKKLAHGHIKEHVDTGAMILNKDTKIEPCFSGELAHLHISAPFLEPFESWQSDISAIASKIPYDRDYWVSAELLNLYGLSHLRNNLTLMKDWVKNV